MGLGLVSMFRSDENKHKPLTTYITTDKNVCKIRKAR